MRDERDETRRLFYYKSIFLIFCETEIETNVILHTFSEIDFFGISLSKRDKLRIFSTETHIFTQAFLRENAFRTGLKNLECTI